MCDEFIVMWDMYGLESIINITEINYAAIISGLKNEKITQKNPIHYMILRARFNSQRRYEIYQFESELTKDEIIKCFRQDSQSIVNIIRRIGVKLYSDRIENDKILIQ